jgi:hypothetical protein
MLEHSPHRSSLVIVLVIVAVSAFLIFFRLDQRLLWVDEAETALLGRSILAHGVPTAWDGRNLISQEVGREFGPDYVWYWTPWLDKYLAATSFALLGESTFSARLPFAILGLLSVVSIYPLGFVLFRDRWIAVLAMAFLALSVPFILHVRQCRYYSAVILCSIWALYFFVGLARGRRLAIVGFVVAMTVLFQASIVNGAATALAFLPCLLVQRFDPGARRHGTLAAGLVLLLNLPSVYAFALGKGEPPLHGFTRNIRDHLILTNRYTLPIVALAVFLALAWLLRRRMAVPRATWRTFLLIPVFVAAYLVAVSVAPWAFYRYTVGILPLAAALFAFMCAYLWTRNRAAGAAFTACLLLTGLFHVPLEGRHALETGGRSFPAYDVCFPLGNYLHEVTHPYEGPMERLLALLSRSAAPTDRVFITYGDLILAFYTSLEVRGGQSGRTLDGWPEPEWIVVRSFFRFADRPHLRADATRMRTWLESVSRDRYRPLSAPWTDVPWDNIPEPQFHWFRIPEAGRPMVVARRADRP